MRLQLIDALRGIAASAVMLFHFYERVGSPWWGKPLDYGYLGVAIFFVLSGFVITMSVGDRKVGAGFLGRFALRRSIRLDPLYWCSIAATLAIGFWGAKYGVHQAPVTAPQILAHLVYLQDIVGYKGISPIYWTLCYEIQFYLTLVVFIWGMQRVLGASTQDIVRKPLFLVAFFGLFVLSVAQRSFWHGLPDSLALNFWFCFALGALTFWVNQGWLRPIYWYACVPAAFVWGVAFNDHWYIVSSGTSAVIFVAGRLNRMDALSGPVMQFLGRISYSMYITHILFGWYATSIAMRFVNAPLSLLAGVIVSLISSYLAYRFIEKPSVAWSRKVQLESGRANAPAERASATATR